jgi:hypothetical protein
MKTVKEEELAYITYNKAKHVGLYNWWWNIRIRTISWWSSSTDGLLLILNFGCRVLELVSQLRKNWYS